MSKLDYPRRPMTLKRILLAAAAAAVTTGPVWALPALAPADPGKGNGPPATTPSNTANPGASHRSTEGAENAGGGEHGKSGLHKCVPHKAAYVASGILVSEKLEKNADGTYSGELTVEVKQTNHHAKGDKGTTKTYKEKEVEKVHITFGLADTNNDGGVGLDDVKAGDRVSLIGKITTLAKKCDHTQFTATTTLRKIVFHAPPAPGS
jgi:hypothetical protein